MFRDTLSTMNEERMRAIARVLGEVGVEGILRLEDVADPQLRVLSSMARSLKSSGWASLYALLNALVSYRLTVRGEKWWSEFSEYISSKRAGRPPGSVREAAFDVVGFLEDYKGVIIQRAQKISRLRRALSASASLETLALHPMETIFEGYEILLSSIASALGQRPYDKTIVLSLKMAYYALRGATGDRRALPPEIPIPVDVRVSCISYSSGLMEVSGDPVKGMMSRPDLVRRAWKLVSEISGIPSLHIDTVIWLIGWAPRKLHVDAAKVEAENIFSRALDRQLSIRLSRELVIRSCSGRWS